MTESTARFGLPLLVQGQGQKDVTHNEALAHIDMVLHPSVVSRADIDPPADPQPGQAWLVPANAEGVWIGHERQLAAWTDGGWRYLTLEEGALLWVQDEQRLLCRNNQEWRPVLLSPVPAAVIDAPVGGVTVDAEARTVLTVLLAHLRNVSIVA